MSLRLVLNVVLLFASLSPTVSGAALSNSLQKGKDYYFAGEFKKAISQFKLMVKANPNDAESYLWLGKSYSVLADTKAPVFAGRARLKARMYLAKAVDLAPESADYRRELFHFLISSGDSPAVLRKAKAIAQSMHESDAEYATMESLLAEVRRQRSSPENLTSELFGIPSQAFARLSVRQPALER